MSGVGVIILSTQWLAVVGSVPTSSTWVSPAPLMMPPHYVSEKLVFLTLIKVPVACVCGRKSSPAVAEPHRHGWVCLQAAIQAAGTALANINQQAVAIGSISLLCALYTPKAIAKFVPGSLIGLLAGTATAYFGKLSESAPVPVCPGLPISLPTILKASYLFERASTPYECCFKLNSLTAALASSFSGAMLLITRALTGKLVKARVWGRVQMC